jgi:hypothetical protein
VKIQLKEMSVLFAMICVLATGCGASHSDMTQEIESARGVLNSIEATSVSSNSLKAELLRDKMLLLAQATALNAEVILLEKVEHGKFIEEQKRVQVKVDDLVLSASRLKGRVARIQAVDAMQSRLDALQGHINDLKEKAKTVTGEIKDKINTGIADLETQKTNMLSSLAELNAHIKDTAEGFWASITAASDRAWAF